MRRMVDETNETNGTNGTSGREAGEMGERRLPRGSWEDFEGRLSTMLASLEDDEFLILAVKDERAHPGAYVQFAGGGPGGLLAEAVSDDYLVTLPLSETQRADLVGFGWTAPPGDPAAPANYRRTWDAPVPVDEVARLTVRTLRRVYGVRSPHDLMYRRFSAGEPDAPEQALARVEEPSAEELRELVARTLGVLFEVDDVRPDPSGAWAVYVGEHSLALNRVGADGSLLRVAIAVRRGEAPTPALHAALNEANGHLLVARAVRVEETVYCAAEVPTAGLTLDLLARTIVAVVAGSQRLVGHLESRLGRPEPAEAAVVH